MKNFFLVTFLFITSFSFAQITLFHTVYVEAENQAKFEAVEVNYMSKLAQQAVNDGKFGYWSLEKVIHPMTTMGGKLNVQQLAGNWYQFVIVYADLEAYMNAGPWWADAGEKMGIPQELLAYEIEQGGMYLWSSEDYVFGDQAAKFSVYNFGFAEEPQAFFDSQAPHKKNFENQMKNNEMGRAGWVSAHRISPKNWGEHNVMTWDGFLTLKDALNHLSYKESQKGYTEQGMPSGFDLRMVCEKIVETSSSN